MQKRKWFGWLVLLICLLLPGAAWATEVPEVTADEYRYYLEYSAWSWLDEVDFSHYSDAELQQLVKKAVEEETGDYVEELEFVLWDDYMFEEADMGKFTEAELEKFMARALSDEACNVYAWCLKKEYQIEIDPADYTPQEIKALYYKTCLREKYQITEGVETLTWYQLEDLYYRIERENNLREKYGVTEDLSHYTKAELIALNDRLWLEQHLRDTYGVTEDLSHYTEAELDALENRLSLEQLLREEYGVTENLTNYTVAELEEMYDAYCEQQWQQEQAEARTQINIQINGEKMYFPEQSGDDWRKSLYKYSSDVRPVIKEDRVYIPFRAVFETLGAEVSYDTAGNTVMAKRDNKTVSFMAGQSQYVMNGVTIQMDAETFVKDGRTFVPVRFASQALGAAVGWDNDTRTVVILERDKVINRYKGKFTVVEKYLQHWDMSQGNLAMQGKLNLTMQIRTNDENTGKQVDVPLSLIVEMEQLSSDTVVNTDTTVRLDMAALLKLWQQEAVLDKEAVQRLNKLQNFRLQYLVDVETGIVYIKSDLLDLFQGQKNAWYRLSIQDYLDETGYQEYVQLVQKAQQEAAVSDTEFSLDEVLTEVINEMPLNDSYDVQSTLEGLQALYRVLGDPFMGKIAEGYVHSITAEDGVNDARIIFLGNQEQINGLRISFALESGDSVMHMTIEEQNHVICFHIDGDLDDWDTQVILEYNGEFAYRVTDEEPQRKPADGESVYDLMRLLEDYNASLPSYEQEADAA